MPSLLRFALLLCCLPVWLVPLGCSRLQYRQAADGASYRLVASRQIDPRWDIPERPVEPEAASRLHMPAPVDCGPKPMDDPAAHKWMDCPAGLRNQDYYDQIPTQAQFENPLWLDRLPRKDNGQIDLTETLAVDLALLHSRTYQTQFEAVYLTALTLTGNRFEFDTQWFGGGGVGFTASGEDLGDQRLLEISDRLGFSKSLAGGGQFATSILNSLFWDFGTGGFDGGSASVVTTFTQPLLRGAFRHVRLENLTQAERNLLYSVRDFARFRRTFYLDVMSDYLDLLTQLQAIRNTRTNVENLRLSLAEYELYAELGTVSPVEVDQVYQNYQTGRLRLIAAEQSLADSLDRFKFQLGLPAWIPFEIDESLLEPFELVDPELERLQAEAQALYESMIQYLPPERAPKAVLAEGFDSFQRLRNAAVTMLPQIKADLADWMARIEGTEEANLSPDDLIDLQQQRTLAERLEAGIADLENSLAQRESLEATLREAIESYDPEGSLPPPGTGSEESDGDNLAWSLLVEAIGEGLRRELAELYVAQTQVRLFLIQLDPLQLEEQTAVTFAHQNRLDLMNQQASVMDAFRRMEVAADALESDLAVRGDVILGSDPSKNNAFRFDSSANRYRVGVEFDGPLNRLNERNIYRARQIEYQRVHRDYIATRDAVANEVRAVLRQLQLSRLNFQIARQQLVAATRQVDQAQIDVRTGGAVGGADSNLTIFLLQALQGMLEAKNNLISNWISYRIQKIRLFTTLELLYLDESGHWNNEQEGLDSLEQMVLGASEYYPTQWSLERDLPADWRAPEPEQAFEPEQVPRPEQVPEPREREAVPPGELMLNDLMLNDSGGDESSDGWVHPASGLSGGGAEIVPASPYRL